MEWGQPDYPDNHPGLCTSAKLRMIFQVILRFLQLFKAAGSPVASQPMFILRVDGNIIWDFSKGFSTSIFFPVFVLTLSRSRFKTGTLHDAQKPQMQR